MFLLNSHFVMLKESKAAAEKSLPYIIKIFLITGKDFSFISSVSYRDIPQHFHTSLAKCNIILKCFCHLKERGENCFPQSSNDIAYSPILCILTDLLYSDIFLISLDFSHEDKHTDNRLFSIK